MCPVFVDFQVQVLDLKFRVFATTENCHRYKLLTNKHSCIFMRNNIFLLLLVNSSGFGTCSLLCTSVKLQIPATVNIQF